jgi:hypothetical protein
MTSATETKPVLSLLSVLVLVSVLDLLLEDRHASHRQ